MSLDDELRSVFAHEARTRVAPFADPQGVVRGGRARRRRRNLERAGAGLVAAALIGAGGYALVPDTPPHPGVASRPSATHGQLPPPVTDMGRSKLPSGTHRMFVGTDGAGVRIEADFTVAGPNWSGGDFPLVADRFGSTFAGIGVYQPTAVASGSGCVADEVTSDLGPSPRRLAHQLAELPRSTILEEPSPTHVFGHDGFHLRLQIRVQCPSYYRVAATPGGDRDITYPVAGWSAEDVIIDFWVIDVGGALVVVDEWHNADASDSLVEQAARARTSIEVLVGA